MGDWWLLPTLPPSQPTSTIDQPLVKNLTYRDEMSANQGDSTEGETVPRASVSAFTVTAPASTPTYDPYATDDPDNDNAAAPSEAPSGTPSHTAHDDRWYQDLESGSPKATGYSDYFPWSMRRSSGRVSNQAHGERLASWQASSQKHPNRGAQPDAYVDVEAQGGPYDQAAPAPTILTRIGSGFSSALNTAQDLYAANIASRTPKPQKGPPRNPGEIV